jgi:exopolyphosphatase/pppGpp-phosphohydrolase
VTSDPTRRPAGPAAWLIVLSLLAPLPAHAEQHGGIEIGAKGVKAAVLDVSRTAAGYQATKAVSLGSQNATLSAGVAASGELDPKAVQVAVEAVKGYLAVMEKKYKVPAGNIYVVGSSGIFASLSGKEKAVAAGKAALAAAVRKGTGRPLDFITPEQEAELSIVGGIPRAFRATSLLLDVGSGNTKGGCLTPPRTFTLFSVPYGSVTFSVLTKKQFAGETPGKAAALAGKDVLAPALRKAVGAHPGLLGRDRVYLSGGAVWALATYTRPADRETFTALTAEDIQRYRKALAANPKGYPAADLSAVKGAAAREAAEKEISKVKKAFTPEQLLAGAEILDRLSEEFKLGTKKVYFARYGSVSWILAYAARKAAKP